VPLKHLLKIILPPKWRRDLRERLVQLKVRHLYGPKRIQLSSNEAVVTCVVRNGAFYLDSFIRHYTQMGFRHIFFMDNGSTDQTISIARRYDNVSVCQCDLPIMAHQPLFKKYLARKSAEGGWRLDADVDEFFAYPFSDVLKLSRFLDYLNKSHYTAVLTQTLDMFSVRPIHHVGSAQQNNLQTGYEYYDISEITKIKYHYSELVQKYGHRNRVSNPDSELFFGGIRKTLFGHDWTLTKHSLFFPEAGVELFPNVHFVNNATLADLSCLILHYKLTSNALDIARQNKDNFPGNGKMYDDFISYFTNHSECNVAQGTAVRFLSARELVDRGFLFVSDEYRRYAMNHANG
jgi:hypothetical protein